MPERFLKRDATYYFRAKHLADLRHLFKASDRWRSLGTKELADAKLKVRVESVRFDAEMAELRRRLSEPTESTSALVARARVPAAPSDRLRHRHSVSSPLPTLWLWHVTDRGSSRAHAEINSATTSIARMFALGGIMASLERSEKRLEAAAWALLRRPLYRGPAGGVWPIRPRGLVPSQTACHP